LKGPYSKRRNQCVLFLDDGFDAEETPTRLTAAGYVVQRFIDHFKRPEVGGKEQNVKDPRLIEFCSSRGWLLVTTDSEMRFTHVDSIKKSQVAILATAHNSVPKVGEWVEGLIKGKVAIERLFKKQQRPCFAQFSRQGKITVCYTVGEEHKSRRKRPREL
jgi:hypothetical protein